MISAHREAEARPACLQSDMGALRSSGARCTNVSGVNGAMSDEAGPWRTFGARGIYESPDIWFGQVDVELPGGERVWEPVVRLHQSAFMAALDGQGRVLLVRRHRFVAGEWGWELPGGLVDEEEDAAAAATRELEDVSGFQVARAEELIRFRPMAETVDCEHVAFVGREPERVVGAGGNGRTGGVDVAGLGARVDRGAGDLARGDAGGVAAVASAEWPLACLPECLCKHGGMRLLVLGGTRFVGWAVVAGALERGWEVATFHRGLSGRRRGGCAFDPGGSDAC